MANSVNRIFNNKKTVYGVLFFVVIGLCVFVESLGPVLYNLENVWDWKGAVSVICYAFLYSGVLMAFMTIFHKYSLKILMILVCVYSVFAYMNLLHYRGLDTYFPFYMLKETQQLNGLSDSIIGLMHWYDCLYLWPSIFVVALYVVKDRVLMEFNWSRHIIYTSITLIIALLPVLYLNKIRGLEFGNWHSGVYFSVKLSPSLVYKKFGLFPIISYQISSEGTQNVSLSDEDRLIISNHIDTLLLKNKENIQTCSSKQNVVIMLMESFNTNCINPQYMPTVYELCHEQTSLFYPKTKQLTHGAMSIGGQLMIMSGLHGLINTPFCSSYPLNVYPSIAREVEEQYDSTYSYTVVSSDKYYWRQNEVSRSLGFDHVFDKDDGMTLRGSNGWADDSEVFSLASSVLPNDSIPFCCLIVPSNMHAPYSRNNIISCDVTFENIEDVEAYEYFRRAHYLDEQVRDFINVLKQKGLYESTLIVITSDHQVPEKYCNSSLKSALSEYIPVIFANTGIDRDDLVLRNSEIVFCHSQVYPTILQLMGICPKNYFGLFPSMLDITSTEEFDFENLDYSTTSNEKLREIYEMGEMIIKSGYFGKI